MPPPNSTPETAKVITALPYSDTQDPTGSPDSTYVGSCAAEVTFPLWYVYTPPAGITALGLTLGVNVSTPPNPDYFPFVSIWTGALGSLTQLPDQCGACNYPLYAIINVTPGTAYYFQIVGATSGGPPDAFPVFGLEAPADPAVSGDILVSNDTPLAAAVVMDRSGTVLRFLGLPAFESGSILPTGELCCAAETTLAPVTDTYVESYQIFDPSFALIATETSFIAGSTKVIATSPVCNDGVDTFYISRASEDFPVLFATTVTTISNTGVLGGTVWTLPHTVATGDTITGMCVNPAETILYYASLGASFQTAQINRYDIIGDAPLTALVGPISNLTLGRDLLYTAAGELLVAVFPTSGGGSTEVRRYNSTTGALIGTFASGHVWSSPARICLDPLDGTKCWVMDFPTSNTSRFTQYTISTGAVGTQFSVTQSKSIKASSGTSLGPSQSCPLLMLTQDLGLPTPVISSLTQPACATTTNGTVTIEGVNFPAMPTVTVTGPTGTVSVSVVSSTSTQIVVSGSFSACGQYCFSVDGSDQLCIASYQTFSTRRLRRFPHVSEQQMLLFWRRLQIDIEAGRANLTGQGTDPQIMLRWSNDGGHTWSPEQWVSAGLRGEYGRRAIWTALGRSRDRVYELSVSDPVPWVFLNAIAVVEKGVS